MATAPKAKKKIGPFSPLGWAGIGGGTLVVFYLYKRYTSASASTGAQSSNLAGGTSIPSGSVTTTGPTSTGTTFTTWAEWEAAAIAALATGANYSPTQAFNDLTAWYNGQCVSSIGYNLIGGFIASNGLPPGGSNTSLQVCPTSGGGTGGGGSPPAPGPTAPQTSNAPQGGPPNLPAALAAAMQKNGESIVSTAWDPIFHTWIYLTNKGGVYNLSPAGGQGAGYAGSYLSLPAAGQQGGPRTFVSVKVDAKGGYTLVDTNGETYHFGP